MVISRKDEGRAEPGPKPFVPKKLLTMFQVWDVNHVTGIHPATPIFC